MEMDLLINGQRYAGLPDELASVVQEYAGRQGRTAICQADGALRIDGPLLGRRFQITCVDDDPDLRAVAEQAGGLLRALGAEEEGAAITAAVGLCVGEQPVVGPAGLFSAADRTLAGALREGMQRHSGRPVREAPLLGRGWRPDPPAPAALVMVAPGQPSPAVLGLVAGLLRFGGISPEQVEALDLPQFLGGPAEEHAEPLIPTGDGGWISPRALACHTPDRTYIP